jgi:hypothetical protein
MTPQIRSLRGASLLVALSLIAATASAASLLIRDAKVHTAAAAGTLEHTDVLVQDGRIAAIGPALTAAKGVRVIDAEGKPLTPGLFGGLSFTGVMEIGLEPSAEDQSVGLGNMRPEFDLTLAYNPDAPSVAVNRMSGVTFTMLAPSPQTAKAGGTLIAGQGAMMRLDGRLESEGDKSRALFIDLGGDAVALSGGSRAAQFMLLRQAFVEARTPAALTATDLHMLTPAGRQQLGDWLRNHDLMVFDVDRASDIRQLLAFAKREDLRVAIGHGNEAWRVAPALAAAHVTVIVDPLEDLPSSFDSVGATMENAARLARGGVSVAFSIGSREPYNARKLRQAAGNAVAHGMPWEAALAAITRVPAQLFGMGDQLGTIEVGKQADLVLWSGDPLEVTSLAREVLIAGRPSSMRSRQTELRDRYLERLKSSFGPASD